MKLFKTKSIIASLLLAGGFSASAQTMTYSGYFLDNYDYRFQMNPAMGNEKGFVSMPALGNMNIAFRGNLHLSSVLYNYDGQTVLFTNPNISAKEVMKNIHDKNRLGTDLKLDILSVGFKALGGYNTVSVSTIADVELSVPGSFFSLAKEGLQNKTYNIRNLNGYANAYAQIALNHSRDIKQIPGLRVGAAVKFLISAGAFDFRFNEADLTLGTDSWSARTNAEIYAAVCGFRFKTDTYNPKRVGEQPYQYVSGGEIDGYKIGGFGLGFDLGAEYKWNDFRFSVAILDLGFINHGKAKYASTNGTREFDTDAYIFNVNDNASNSFDNELDRMTDNISKLYQLEDMGERNFTRSLATTLNFGVDYEFPLYRKLHFGLLNSTRINGRYTRTQFRLSANVAPVKCFSANVNLGVGTFGADFGWMLNFHHTGFNLFLGMDHTLGKLAKQFVPLNSNGSVNLGINFPF